MKPKPFVGQKLWSLNVGNSARSGREQVPYPVTVTSVGSKYFRVKREDFNFQVEFFLEDWREHSEYSPNHALYATEQEWLDKKEASEIKKLLREFFGNYGTLPLSLDALRRIKAICEEQSTQENLRTQG